MAEPASWDLQNEDWEDITDWTDIDAVNGVSSENPSGQLQLDSGAAASGSLAGRSKNLAAAGYSTAWTWQAKMIFDKLASGASSYFEIQAFPDTAHTVQWYVFYSAANLATFGIYDATSGTTISRACIKTTANATWFWLRMVVNMTSHPTYTANVYYSEDGTNWERILTNVPCHYNNADTRGVTGIYQFGYNAANQKCHMDDFKLATGAYDPTGWYHTYNGIWCPATVNGVANSKLGTVLGIAGTA